MTVSSEELRWATDHNAQIVRAYEQKSQIYIGMMVVFLPLANANAPLLGLPSNLAALVWTAFGIAVLLNIRVVVPVVTNSVKAIGDTPIFWTKPSQTEVSSHLAQLAKLDSAETLGRELFKIQLIRQIKAGRFNLAHWATITAFVTLLLCMLLTTPTAIAFFKSMKEQFPSVLGWLP